MKSPEYYRGREQTYQKHFFLERYLESVAYHIGYSNNDFVYVDGFSGPWKSEDENFDDTSFMIALQKLRNVREGLGKVNRYPKIRCLFIEKEPQAFKALGQAIKGVPRVEVEALHGEFEALIPRVLNFIGGSFSLVFIDPTGWKGFGLKQITPILKHRPGEIIINFMFDYINRFFDHPEAEITETFDALFGGPGWNEAVSASPEREKAMIELYCDRVKKAGEFAHVTYARIDKPTADRTYFYLVYGTRHPKGLIVFRKVEKGFTEEQGRVRLTAKQNRRIERTGQNELFGVADADLPERPFEQERTEQLKAARIRLIKMIEQRPRNRFEDVQISLLEMPLIWESDIKEMVKSLCDEGRIDIEGMKGRERTPKPGHVLVRK
jgi:three-Cys-motif partner protein